MAGVKWQEEFRRIAQLLELEIQVGMRRFVPTCGTHASVCALEVRRCPMSKETPADDPRQKTDGGSLKQTDKPWKGAAGEGTEAERSHAGSRKVAGNPTPLWER